MKYASFIIVLCAFISYPLYAYLNPSLDTIIAKQNQLIREANNTKLEIYRSELIECIDSASGEILSQLDACQARPKPILQEFVGSGTGKLTPTPSEPPSKGYTAKHQLVLTGFHDYRIYSDRLGASWKNNNPSGLTWGVSNTLKSLWKERGIEFEKGTLRPKNEGGNYILFSSIEHGLRAKVIAIRERWGKATVEHFLIGWGTDYVKLSFPTSKIIKDLSEEEFAELFIQQMKKESPGLTSQLVADGILIIN